VIATAKSICVIKALPYEGMRLMMEKNEKKLIEEDLHLFGVEATEYRMLRW
jgi:hypothetical protein